MKILLINKFLYAKGGDATATLATGELLKKKGHEVIFWGMNHPLNPPYEYQRYFVENIDFNESAGIFRKIELALNVFYSFEAEKKFEKLVASNRPDLIHLNNFAHQISPSILNVIKRRGIAAVMTMHDYKMVCPSYSMLAGGKPCERCKGGRFYQCFINKCTKDSYLKSLINTLEMYLHHNILHIYDPISVFISPSEFMKNKLEEMGFRGKIARLPYPLMVEKFEPVYGSESRSVVYFGRLSREKGLFTLIDAFKYVEEARLKIIGDGPLKDALISKANSQKASNVEFLGYKKGEDLKREIKNSIFTVIASECYENFPMSVMESFAFGKPVVGSRIGGIPELVKDGQTGITFEPGNAYDLASKIRYLAKSPEKVIEMGKNARKMVEDEFNGEKHYEGLMAIYEEALKK
ncbi:MAG: glycosyltransferase family 4 protein [Candidatus Omnitrophica bacterium]|nr:glycosyltransferase family 4 protein [Candidatus Omnitrophota bacterium]MCM8791033.1 glycosyltransferase family 4 protein [Candidatus Omnitrophota bacterium]